MAGHLPPVGRDDEHPLRRHVGTEKVSLRDWRMEPKDVLEALTGVEPKLDKRTRQLSLPAPPR